MFANVGWFEVVILLLVALFIFGDKLPKAISDGLNLLRNVRRMARSATADLSRELGTDIQLEDLHPKTFLRKHVLSEADQEALIRPIKGLSEDLERQTRGIQRELKEAGRGAQAAAEDVKRATDLSSVTPLRSADKPAAPPAPRTTYDDLT